MARGTRRPSAIVVASVPRLRLLGALARTRGRWARSPRPARRPSAAAAPRGTQPIASSSSNAFHIPTMPGAAAGRIDDPVGPAPVHLLGELVGHRLLAFDAVRLLERRHVVPARAARPFRGDPAGIGDQPVDQRRRRAPYNRHSSTNGCLTSRGMNTFAREPGARPHRPPPRCRRCRRSAARSSSRRGTRARVIAADWPRALNELVGLSDSSLTYSALEAERARRAPRA